MNINEIKVGLLGKLDLSTNYTKHIYIYITKLYVKKHKYILWVYGRILVLSYSAFEIQNN